MRSELDVALLPSDWDHGSNCCSRGFRRSVVEIHDWNRMPCEGVVDEHNMSQCGIGIGAGRSMRSDAAWPQIHGAAFGAHFGTAILVDHVMATTAFLNPPALCEGNVGGSCCGEF